MKAKTISTALTLFLSGFTAMATQEPTPMSKDALEIAGQLLNPEALNAADYARDDSIQVHYVVKTRNKRKSSYQIEFTRPWSDGAENGRQTGSFLLDPHDLSGSGLNYSVAVTQCACDGPSAPNLETDQRLMDAEAERVAQLLLSSSVDTCVKSLGLANRVRNLKAVRKLIYNGLEKYFFEFEDASMTIGRSFAPFIGPNGSAGSQMMLTTECEQK